MSAEATMKNLGIELPNPPTPLGSYVGAVQTGNLVYISGQGPRRPDGTSIMPPSNPVSGRRRSRTCPSLRVIQ